MNRLPPAVLLLLVVNAAVFLAGMLVPVWGELIIRKGAYWYPTNENHASWQPVTYMFLHGGLGHLFFNMFALVSFGMLLEQQWGTRRFLAFYFLCGIGAGLIHTAVSTYEYSLLYERLVGQGLTPAAIDLLLTTGRGEVPAGADVEKTLVDLYRIYAAPMLGASGAIYGILVAFGLMYPNAKLGLLFIPVPVAAKFFIPGMLALDLLSGVTGFSLFGGGVAHFAHLGGAAIGFLLMLMWRRRARPQEAGPSAESS